MKNHKKTLIAFLLGVMVVVLIAATPSYQQFLSSQFGIANNIVKIKDGAKVTNIWNYGNFTNQGVMNINGAIMDNSSITFSDGGLLEDNGGVIKVSAFESTGPATIPTIYGNLSATGTVTAGVFQGGGTVPGKITLGTNNVNVTLESSHPGGELNINTNQVTVDSTTGFVGINQTNPTTRLHVVGNTTIQRDNLEAAGTNAIRLTNATAAVSGTQQASPGIEWSGNGYATTPAASRSVRFFAKLLPVQGTTVPSGVLNILASTNDSAYNDAAPALSINNLGGVGIGVSAASISGGFVSVAGGAAIVSASSGAYVQWPTTGTLDFATVNGSARNIRFMPAAIGSTLFSNKVAFPSLNVQTLVAGAAMTNNAVKLRVIGSGGAVTLTSTPSLRTNDVLDGTFVIIQGTDDTSTVTVQDNGTLAGSLVELENGITTRVLGKGDLLTLLWDTTDAKWYEHGFKNN